ncbi:hypothetical protein [Sphingomonas sp.]|uniref:hypothetical protein n=1 Tax=Sphingomonas sp. TaxID=28214 RepID=UPI003AFF8414
MRQVNHDELAWKIVMALRPISRTVWKAAADPRPQVRGRAVSTIADKAADALRYLEVLSGDPAASEATFSRPMARLRGEVVGSGAPMMEIEDGPR